MFRAGQGLILLTITLLLIGVLMVNSAGVKMDGTTALDIRTMFLGKQMILALLAVSAMLVAASLPIDRFMKLRGLMAPAPWIVLMALGLLVLVQINGIGHEANGATRWIDLGFVRFQPSEFAKWGLIIVIAWHGARRVGSMGRFFTGFLPPMVIVGLLCVLIAREDLGTAVLIGAVAVCMLVAAGARLLHAATLIPLGVLGFIAALKASPYRIERIQAFLDPYADPQDTGHHMIQSMAAVSSGGLPGHGLGNGIQKFEYLPEDTTDFIFAIICEELGVAGVATVLTLYVLLLGCGFTVLRHANSAFSRLVTLGVLLTIGFQALINLAVVTGLGPTKGIALPLISAGGTGWVLCGFSIGLLVAIDRVSAHTTEHSMLRDDLPLVPEGGMLRT